MTTSCRGPLIVAVVVLSSSAGRADGQTPPPQSQATAPKTVVTFFGDRSGRSKPLSNLFNARPLEQTPPSLVASPTMPLQPQPQIICGMQVFPANPNVDPRMKVFTPDPDTKHTLRVVKPPICQTSGR